MKDIKGFVKLFGINIPVYEEFDYYIDQLSKTHTYKDIKSMVSLYEEAEGKVDDIFGYKMSKLNEIVEYVKNTRAYTEMSLENLYMMPTNNASYKEGVNYLSIDLAQANWNSIKKFDPLFLNEMGDTYEDFLDKFDLPEVFKHSKQFRQLVFGNLNPKRQVRVQRNQIQEVVDDIKDNMKLESIMHDEVIYSFSGDVTPLIESYLNDPKYHVRGFTIENVENFKIRSYYNEKGEFLYKDFNGCPGNIFYFKLKQYITKEELDIRDFLFRVEKRTAVWYDENLKISL